MIALRIKKGLADHFWMRFAEWILTIESVCFAETLLEPGDTFDSSPSYTLMAKFASERTWGLVIALVAGARLTALVLNGSFPGSRRWSPLARSVCAGLSSGVWFCVSIGMVVSNVNANGWKTYGVMSCADLMLSVMIARSAGAAFEAYRGEQHDAR